jgi:hypothetical protein
MHGMGVYRRKQRSHVPERINYQTDDSKHVFVILVAKFDVVVVSNSGISNPVK